MYRPKIQNKLRISLCRFKSQFKVAIIGSGPAGFYTAHHLINKHEDVKVDIFEKLPTPFGLSRYGVAPDHPEVKNCEDTFNQVAKNSRFKYFGNVEIGKDIKLEKLSSIYNAIVFAYGCTKDNKLNIPGEDHPGVISARKFVGWYNGLPEFENLNPPLDQIEDVIIIGNGNVAIDVARILLTPPEILYKTDISNKAIKILEKNNLKKIKIIARRGFLESSFTNKEIRELLELEKFGIKFDDIDEEILKPLIPFKKKFDRIISRRLDLILNQMKSPQDRFKTKKLKYKIPDFFNKSWNLEYLKSPIEIFPNSSNPKIISSINLQKNQLIHDSPNSSSKIKPIKSSTILTKAELIITSIGYKGVDIKGMENLGIKFNEKTGTILNNNGRLINEEGLILNGFYASGWIRKGSAGVIASTMMDSFTTGELILKDYQDGKLENGNEEEDDDDIIKHLNLKNVVNWKDWEKLNKFEQKLGKHFNKSRYKILDIDKMLAIIRDDSDEDIQFTKFKEMIES